MKHSGRRLLHAHKEDKKRKTHNTDTQANRPGRSPRSYERPVLSLDEMPGLTQQEKDYLADLEEVCLSDTVYTAADMHCVKFGDETCIGIPTGPEGNSRMLEFNETAYFLFTCYKEPHTCTLEC